MILIYPGAVSVQFFHRVMIQSIFRPFHIQLDVDWALVASTDSLECAKCKATCKCAVSARDLNATEENGNGEEEVELGK